MNVNEFKEPFRHWIIEGAVGPELAKAAFGEIPLPAWSGWEAKYENDCERHKRTCRYPGGLVEGLWETWNSDFTLKWLEGLTGIAGLQSDPHRHGSGLHVTDPGGHLTSHLDYALHPASGLERRLNLVLFLNPSWEERWGGAFELCDDMGAVAKRVHPACGRAVLWEPGDTAFHGTQRVADDAPMRATLAVYYLTTPRPNVTRKRALFIPKRG